MVHWWLLVHSNPSTSIDEHRNHKTSNDGLNNQFCEVIQIYEEPPVQVFCTFQNQRTVGFASLKKNRNQRIAGPRYYFKTQRIHRFHEKSSTFMGSYLFSKKL
jgi:hypothetical protein